MSDPDAKAKKREAAITAATLAAVYASAKADVLQRLAATGSIRNLLTTVWRELLQRRVRERVGAIVEAVAPELPPASVAGKLDAYSEWFAKTWYEATDEALAQVDVAAADLRAETELAFDAVSKSTHWVPSADSMSREMGTFAAIEKASLTGKVTKTWHNTNAHPRHNALEGVTVPIDQPFSNGQQYPGAPAPPEERVNCQCYLTFGGE